MTMEYKYKIKKNGQAAEHGKILGTVAEQVKPINFSDSIEDSKMDADRKQMNERSDALEDQDKDQSSKHGNSKIKYAGVDRNDTSQHDKKLASSDIKPTPEEKKHIMNQIQNKKRTLNSP